MSMWNKQDWIKDILSKSGTDITEIRDEAENKGKIFSRFCVTFGENENKVKLKKIIKKFVSIERLFQFFNFAYLLCKYFNCSKVCIFFCIFTVLSFFFEI